MDSHPLAIRPPEPFSPGQSPADSWKIWKRQFEIFAEATALSAKPRGQQRAILLHSLGLEGQRIADGLESGEEDRTTSDILLAFDEYFRPYENQTFNRYLFFSSDQQPNQSIDQYILSLKARASACEFGSLRDSLIRDRLICGILNPTVREHS